MPDRIQAAPDAVLGRGDETRRWAVLDPAGRPRFPGIARNEAGAALDVLPEGPWDEYLVAISLPVVLSDGAGPHLLDSLGHLVLGVGDHPHLAQTKLALGPRDEGEQAGVIERLEQTGVWRWRVRADISASHRVAALDALERVAQAEQLHDWLQESAAWV